MESKAKGSGAVKPDILGLVSSIIVWGIKQFKGDNGIMEVVKGTHLQNKEGLEPILMKVHKTETGIDYIFALPPGVGKDEFEKNRRHFESYTNSSCEITSKGRKLVLSTHQLVCQDEIKFVFDPTLYPKMLAPCPIGKTPDGKTIVVDMITLPHMMVGGQTGYGKTSFLLGAMVALLLCGVGVSVIDRKGVDFPRFSPWVNLALDDAGSEQLLNKHIAEMKRRMKLMRESDCQNFAEYREEHELPYLVLFVDELTQIKNKKCFEALGDLSVLSRVAGISLVLATQRPSAKLWDGFTDVRSQLAGAICFYVRDATDSQIVLGSGNTRGAELEKKPGMAIWNNETDTQIQAMYLSAKEAVSILSNQVPRGAYKFETEKSEQPECKEGNPERRCDT
jgi:S-DNA-T family DNA segregation ATPase FtsK/SpoIIIE